jgi:cyanobactin maturation PatA/PatG family protease
MNKFQGLEELQKLSLGNPNIKIAVLDGPVNLDHTCFNTVGGELSSTSSDIITPSGLALSHGTAVTSLIFGKQGSSVEGVSPGCSSLNISIYADGNDGKFSSASQVELASAIETALDQGAHIINISGGQFSNTGDADFLLKRAIDKCYKAGVLIVAATGNDGCNCIHVPAAENQVLAVGAMDENGEPTKETNFGEAYLTNGILARGKNLTAASADGGTFLTGGGTSYAAPIVSGVIGLLMSVQLDQGKKPDAYAIKSILEKTSNPCIGDGENDCRRFLRGSLNLPAALEAIQKNPRILASGIDNNYLKNINEMKENEQVGSSETNVLQNVDGVLQPSANIEEVQTEVTASSSSELSETANLQSESEASLHGPSLAQDDISTPEVEPLTEPLEESIQASDATIIQQANLITNNNINYKKNTMENTITSEAVTALVPEQTNLTSVLSPSGTIDPADCGCGGSSNKPAIVYALGTIAYDFGSESHRDSLVQSMGGGNPHDPAALLAYLTDNPWDAEEIIWTLNIDSTPIYRLVPSGPHSIVGYQRVREFLEAQQNGNIQRVSIPGRSQGTTTLLNGSSVANVYPLLRGMYSWTTEALVGATTSGTKGSTKALAENVTNFLNQVYYKMRNLGLSAEERALNYAATNAFQVSSVFAAALNENLELDDISATKSPICRPGSDCYDVVLSFFNPKERLTVARKQYRFTVDVSDVVPVTVGEVRSWSVY